MTNTALSVSIILAGTYLGMSTVVSAYLKTLPECTTVSGVVGYKYVRRFFVSQVAIVLVVGTIALYKKKKDDDKDDEKIEEEPNYMILPKN
jgi:putative Ca2+/H+ antiporter (TMEM165/GDT1 family)